MTASFVRPVAHCSDPVIPGEEDLLRESLLSSVEVQGGEEELNKSQGWVKLIILAMAYVWPDTPGLKLRTLASVLLVVIVRLLNIAVR